MVIGICIAILLSLLNVYRSYKANINSKEWNEGKCPHCKKGIWLRQQGQYICTYCNRVLFKL